MAEARLKLGRFCVLAAALLAACNYHIPASENSNGSSDLGPGSGPGSPGGGAQTTAFQYLTTNLFQARCGNCHNSARASGGIDLSSHDSILSARTRGGAAVVTPGSPATSHMVAVIEDGSMPPVGGPVSAELVTILKCWITKGAPATGASECLPVSEQKPTTPGNGDSNDNQPNDPPPPVIEPGKPVTFGIVNAHVIEPYCVGCHAGADAPDGIDLSSYQSIMQSSRRAFNELRALRRPLVSPGDPGRSKMWRVVEENEMPRNGDPLPDNLKAILRQWILDGAKP